MMKEPLMHIDKADLGVVYNHKGFLWGSLYI